MSRLNEYLEAVEERSGKWGNWIDIAEVKALPAFKKIEKLGFKLISTDRQLNNGSLVFQSKVGEESKNKDRFSVTANGYIRKEFMNISQGEPKRMDRYYLNKDKEMSGKLGKQITSMEELEKFIAWLAKFLERNPQYHDPKAKEGHDIHNRALAQTRIENRRKGM